MNDVTITYCKPCGYEKRAKEAADALKGNLSVAARLVAGKGGVFEVRVNPEIVARRVKGQFPDIDEIVESVSKAVK
ncbi:SelT/SelW/SelH family protein [Methylocystis sp. S23]|jgi:selenoprotein W-related protein